MERTKITRDVVADALRFLRTSGGLTQRNVCERAAAFRDLGFGRLLESQISDFERGKALPSLGTLINLLAACSDDGREVDFRDLQTAVEFVAHGTETAAKPPPEGYEGDISTLDRAMSRLSRRWTAQLRELIRRHQDEIADLRTRVAQTERLVSDMRGSETSTPGDDDESSVS